MCAQNMQCVSVCMKLNVIGMQLSLMQQRFRSTLYLYIVEWMNEWMSPFEFRWNTWMGECIVWLSFHPFNSIRFISFRFIWNSNCAPLQFNFELFCILEFQYFPYFHAFNLVCLPLIHYMGKLYDFSHYILLRRHIISMNFTWHSNHIDAENYFRLWTWKMQ